MPTFVGATQAGDGQTTQVTSLSVPVHASAVAGNLMVITLDNSLSTNTLTTPTGFTILSGGGSGPDVNGSSFASWLLVKLLTSADITAGSITCNFGATSARAVGNSKTYSAAALPTTAQAAVNIETTASTSEVLPTLTGVASTSALDVSFVRRRSGTGSTTTIPSPYTTPTTSHAGTNYGSGSNVYTDVGYTTTTPGGTVGGETGTQGVTGIGNNYLLEIPAASSGSSAAGSITLGGSVAASAAASVSGSITLGGSATGTAVSGGTAFRASAKAGDLQSAQVSSLSITVPTSGTGGTVAAGDDAAIAVTASSDTVTLTVPSGWTLASGPDRVSGKTSSWLLRKTLVSGDLASSVTLALSGSTRVVATMVVATGTTTSGLLFAASIETTTTTAPKLPSVPSVPAGAFVMAFLDRRYGGTPAPTIGLPSAFTAGPAPSTNYGNQPELSALAGWRVTSATGTISGTGSSSPNSVGTNYVLAYPAAGTPPPPPPPPPVVSSVWPPDPYRAVIRSGGYALTFTVDATLGGAQVAGAVGMSPTGGTITDTTKPGVRRTLNLELASSPGLYDLLSPDGTTLTVTAHIKYSSQQVLDIPMGVFDVDNESLAEGGGKLTVTAPDKWVRLQRAQFLGPYPSNRNASVTSQITTLVRDALGAFEPVTVTATSLSTVGSLVWEKDRAQTIIDLATSIGAWCYFDRYGVFTIADVPQIGASADWLIDASPSGVLLSLDRSRSRQGAYNIVVVSSSASSGPKFSTRYIWDNDPTSNTYAGTGDGGGTSKPGAGTAGPFGQVPYFLDDPNLGSGVEAIAAGRAILARTTGLASQISGDVAPNVAVDAFDSLDVLPPRERYDIARVVERHFVDTVTHSLLPSGAMHIDGRSTRTDTYAG